MNENEAMTLFLSRLQGLMDEPPHTSQRRLAEQMSEMLGSPGGTFRNRTFTKGLHPRLHELHALAEIFDTTVSYLVGDTDERLRVPPPAPSPDFSDDVRRLITQLVAEQRVLSPRTRRRRRRIDER